jgi:hypothetical protein
MHRNAALAAMAKILFQTHVTPLQQAPLTTNIPQRMKEKLGVPIRITETATPMNGVNLSTVLTLVIHSHALLALFRNPGSSCMQVIRRMNLKMQSAIDTTELFQPNLAAHPASPQ